MTFLLLCPGYIVIIFAILCHDFGVFLVLGWVFLLLKAIGCFNSFIRGSQFFEAMRLRGRI